MKFLRYLPVAGLLFASSAGATISITQNNVQVPTSGTLSPFDFLNDGTNTWPAVDLFDGTTHGTFNVDGGFLAHIANSSIAVTGTFWQATQPVSGTFWQATQPISAASLPLPSGAATQTTLASILSALGSPMQASGGTVTVTQATGSNLHVQVDNTNANGSALSANSAPVVIASDQSAVATKGASGAFVAGAIADLAHGQAAMAASVPVVIANNQSAVPTALNATPSLANGNGTVPTQGGAVLSATNGGYTNILQGNAALTAAAGLPVAPSPYPAGSTPITASATGTTAATTATLTNVTGHTTYICGFSIRANATAAATGNATVTGTITGTLNFTQWTAPNASGVGVTEIPFAPCVPASAVSTSIAVVSAAPGTGGVVSVTAWGYSI